MKINNFFLSGQNQTDEMHPGSCSAGKLCLQILLHVLVETNTQTGPIYHQQQQQQKLTMDVENHLFINVSTCFNSPFNLHSHFVFMSLNII